METLFSTVTRSAPVEIGGDVCLLDWHSKKIVNRRIVAPEKPKIIDPNPRGNSRGGRGVFKYKNQYYVAAYHSIYVLNDNFKLIRTISHPQFAGLHEIFRKGNLLIVSSTALNAAIIYCLKENKEVRSYWPGEYMDVYKTLGISKIEIDKTIDNRLNYLSLNITEKDGHLHLNAVDYNGSKYYALFNKFGAICNLDEQNILMVHKYLKGAHNIKFTNENIAYILSTRYGLLLEINIEKKSVSPILDLNKNSFSKKINNSNYFRSFFQKIFGLDKKSKTSNLLFWRGLAITNKYFFIGTSPAAILCFDRVTLKLIDYFQYSQDVRDAVHGLFIEE